jgi:hypothetical protein
MLERRHADRFEIPGAQVEYRLNGSFSSKMPLKDITNGGARFAIQHRFTRGDEVELEIQIPMKDQISVKGFIVWATEADAAVQFLPFGTDDRYNSFESYEQIKTLMRECVNQIYCA